MGILKPGSCSIFLVIIFLGFSGSTIAQTVHSRDSISRVVHKLLKKKRSKLSNLVNDSTGKTFEYSKRSGDPVLTCLKSVSDSVTTEIHFVYENGKLLRAEVAKWYWKVRQAEYDYYYFKNDVFLTSLTDDSDLQFASYLLDTSRALYDEAQELYSTR